MSRYRIPLLAGFNLIAFPGELLQPYLRDIFPPQVLIVMGYQNSKCGGDWETAAYGEDEETQQEEWQGTLELCEPGRGYWVLTLAEGVLEVPIAPLSAYRPTLAAGWNLIGYAGDDLSSAGEVTSDLLSLDEYLEGIDWRVAHTLLQGYVPLPPGALDDDAEDPEAPDSDDSNDFDEARLFRQISPYDFTPIVVGRGYWVWVGEPGEDDDLNAPPSLVMSEWMFESDPNSRMGSI